MLPVFFEDLFICSRVIEQLGGKQLVMNHMHHEDQLVRYNALLCVQKLMVHNWYDPFFFNLPPRVKFVHSCFSRAFYCTFIHFVLRLCISRLSFTALKYYRLQIFVPVGTVGMALARLLKGFSTQPATPTVTLSVSAVFLWEVLLIVPLLSWQRYRGTQATYPSGLQLKQMLVWLKSFYYFIVKNHIALFSGLSFQTWVFVFWRGFFFLSHQNHKAPKICLALMFNNKYLESSSSIGCEWMRHGMWGHK